MRQEIDQQVTSDFPSKADEQSVEAVEAKGKPPTVIDLSETDAANVLNKVYEFSKKINDTNSTPGGVRLPKGYKAEHKAIAPSKTNYKNGRRNGTYLKNYSKLTSAMNSALHILHGSPATAKAEAKKIRTEQSLASVVSQAKVLDTYAFEGEFDLRTPQVLFPVRMADGSRKYVSLAPLPSDLFNKELGTRLLAEEAENIQRLKAKKERKEAGLPADEDGVIEYINRERIMIPRGGSNPQNMSRLSQPTHGYAMINAMVFNTPSAGSEMRKAYAVYHNGYARILPRKKVAEFVQAYAMRTPEQRASKYWRAEQQSRLSSIIHIALKECERTTLRLESALREIDAKKAIKNGKDMQTHVATLHHEDLDALQAGLIDPKSRTYEWFRVFAQWLARYLSQYPVNQDGDVAVDYDDILPAIKRLQGAFVR